MCITYTDSSEYTDVRESRSKVGLRFRLGRLQQRERAKIESGAQYVIYLILTLRFLRETPNQLQQTPREISFVSHAIKIHFRVREVNLARSRSSRKDRRDSAEDENTNERPSRKDRPLFSVSPLRHISCDFISASRNVRSFRAAGSAFVS